MTRKDFELIAGAIASVKSETVHYPADAQRSRDSTLESVAVVMAAALRSTNPRFDRERFLRACGVQA